MVDLSSSQNTSRACPACRFPMFRVGRQPGVWRCVRCQKDWREDDLDLGRKEAESSQEGGGGSSSKESPDFCPNCGSSWGSSWGKKCKNCGYGLEGS